MSTTIKLSDELIKDARRFGEVYRRSIPKQIETGRVLEKSPKKKPRFVL